MLKDKTVRQQHKKNSMLKNSTLSPKQHAGRLQIFNLHTYSLQLSLS